MLCTALLLPLLACAVCLTRAAANAGWFSGPLLRIAAAASSAYFTRRGLHSCAQAAAAARVAGEPDIVNLAENGDGILVLCHVIADADGVNERGGEQ